MASMHDDLALHLVNQLVGTLWNGATKTGTIRIGRLQPEPDTCIFIRSVQGFKTIRGMGASMGDPIGGDRPAFEVTVRGKLFVPTEELANLVHKKYDHFTGTVGNTTFKYIEGLAVPYYLGVDEDNRHQWLGRYRITMSRL